MSSFNPIRRTRIRPKPRQHKESAPWRRPKVRLNGKEMAALRYQVLDRAEKRCENSFNGKRCANVVSWNTYHLHHLQHRSLGGSDTKENCLCLCMDCHLGHHEGLWQIEPHADWKP